MSLRGAIDAWNNRDIATTRHLFDRASNSFKRAGKLDEVSAALALSVQSHSISAAMATCIGSTAVLKRCCAACARQRR